MHKQRKAKRTTSSKRPGAIPEDAPAPPRPRDVTLHDVAAAIGVSASTVSRALRDDPRITKETRRRVKEAASSMRYRPNPYVTAHAIQMRQHGRFTSSRATVAVLETNSSKRSDSQWFQLYLRGIEQEASEQGFQIDRLCLGATGLATATNVAKVLRARNIRGVVIMPVNGAVSLDGIPFPTLASATIDLSLQTPGIDRAIPDYFEGMRVALNMLHARRRRRIGFCTRRSELLRIGCRWMGGYLAWRTEGAECERLAPHVGNDQAGDGPREWRRQRDDFERWLDAERPDAIVSNLSHVPEWLDELGVRVPDEVLFASLGVGPGSPYPGIDQRFERIGAAAFNLVASRIYRNAYGLPPEPTIVMIPPAWVDEGTWA